MLCVTGKRGKLYDVIFFNILNLRHRNDVSMYLHVSIELLSEFEKLVYLQNKVESIK